MRKRTKIIIISVLLIVVASVAYSATREKPLKYTSAKVERGDVIQKVSATGAVEAAKKIDLKFMSTEKIVEVNAKVGGEVKAGDTLAKLDSSKLDTQLAQSQAALVAAQANLETVLKGSTNEQVKVAATAVENAEIALMSAKQSLEDTKASSTKDIQSAQSAVDSSKVALDNANAGLSNTKATNTNNMANVYGAAWDSATAALSSCDDALDTNKTVLDDDDADDVLSVLNLKYLDQSKTSRQAAENAYANALAYQATISSNRTEANVDTFINKSQDALEKTRITLSDTYLVLQATITSSQLTQAELDALKTSISTSRTGINTTISTLTAKEQAIASQRVANQSSLTSAQSAVSSAQSALAVSQSNLASAQSGASAKTNAAQNTILSREGDLKQAQDNLSQVSAKADSSKVLAATAQVDQARSSVELIQNQLKDLILVSPHDGIVTAVNGEAGEIASMTEPFVSLIIPNGFEIKANISEVQIAKLKVGDKVDITFDALGSDEKFTGEISEIDPAETEISGVIYYQVTTLFTGDGEVVKPGMTANLDILTAKKEEVLKVPFQALKEKDDYKYVQVVVKNKLQEIQVEVGLKGDSDYEVKKGLSEGQEVVTFVEE